MTFGEVQAKGATNVIPNSVYVAGTFRTFDEKWRADALQKMKRMAEMIAESMDATCDFEIRKGYPFLVNDDKLTRQVKSWSIDYLGKDNVVDLPTRMTAEDFAYYSHHVPACFYRLGTGNPSKGITSPVHTNTFDIDEGALEISSGLMAWLAIQELAS